MGVVAPTTGVLAAVVPVTVGFALEGVPPPSTVVGIALALRRGRPGHAGARSRCVRRRRASSGGCSAAWAIGLFNVCIGQLSGAGAVRAAGHHPPGPGLASSLPVILLARQPWRMPWTSARGSWSSACWTWPATRRSSWPPQAGDLAIAATLSSLYPVVTVHPRDRGPPRAPDAQPRGGDRAHGRGDPADRPRDRGLLAPAYDQRGEDLRQGRLRGPGDVRARRPRRRDAAQGRADRRRRRRSRCRSSRTSSSTSSARSSCARCAARSAATGWRSRPTRSRSPTSSARWRGRWRTFAAPGPRPCGSRGPRPPCATSGSPTASSVRRVLEHVTIADVVAGELPADVRSLLDDEDASSGTDLADAGLPARQAVSSPASPGSAARSCRTRASRSGCRWPGSRA